MMALRVVACMTAASSISASVAPIRHDLVKAWADEAESR